jgi:hypothetical protein
MALSPEKQAQLDALNAEANAADEDDEFDGEEIEVWNEKGAGARLRGKHSRQWLIDNGFLKPKDPPPSDDDGGNSGDGNDGKAPKGRQSKGTPPRTSQKYFGSRTK